MQQGILRETPDGKTYFGKYEVRYHFDTGKWNLEALPESHRLIDEPKNKRRTEEILAEIDRRIEQAEYQAGHAYNSRTIPVYQAKVNTLRSIRMFIAKEYPW